ncbi:MAG: DUF4097 family beta strand repeat protein [Luteitalea sp.]|nr:DUF4097 family beta strand repeat protein [Luteitalea sp.]
MTVRPGMRLVVVFGAAIVGLAGVASAQDGQFERTLSVSGPVTLEVKTASGGITVRRGGGGTVQVKGTIRAHRRWLEMGDVAAYIREVEAKPPIAQDGNRIRLALPEKEEVRRRLSISYDVTVPAETDVTADSGSGSITIDGLEGTAQAEAGSGSVHVSNVAGRVRAHTGSGSVTLEAVGQGAEAETGSGSIKARDVNSDLTASTGSGRITASLLGQGTVKAHTGSGSIEISGINGAAELDSSSGGIRVDGEPNGDWTVDASSGSITIDVPDEAAFRIDARSSSGSIDVDHPVTIQGTVGRKRLQGTVRGGGSLLALSTASGSIRVQ